MELLIPALLSFAAIFTGGLFAIKYHRNINLILAFSAGVILGVIFFDIMPEVFELTNSTGTEAIVPMVFIVVGFVLFHILEKTVLIHHAHEHDYAKHSHPEVGKLSAIAMITHTLLDGISIGLGFQISFWTGILITLAIIGHNFADGLSTVSLMLHNRNSKKKTIQFLSLAAISPIVGVLITRFFVFPEKFLLFYLAFFAGMVLYISASDILPEAHSEKKSYLAIILTLVGIILIYAVTAAVSAVK